MKLKKELLNQMLKANDVMNKQVRPLLINNCL